MNNEKDETIYNVPLWEDTDRHHKPATEKDDGN